MKRIALLLSLSLLVLTGSARAEAPAEFKGHQGLVFGVAFSPDGQTLATASFDNTVKLWDFATGKEKMTLKGHTAPVYAVVYNQDGTLLATAGQDKSIRLWDPKDGKFLRECKGHTEIVDTLAFSPDGKTLASGSADKSVKLWNPQDGKEIKALTGHKESVYTVAFSPNGELLASGSNDTTIKLWDVKGQKELKMFGTPPKEPEKPAPKKKKEDKKEAKKDEPKKEEPKTVVVETKELPEGVTGVVFTPDNKELLSVGFDKKLHYWSIADGKEIKKLPPTPDDLFGLALSRDGHYVATSGYGGSLRVYEIATGKEVFNHHLKKMVTYCVQFTPDGKALVTGHEKDNAARVTSLPALPALSETKKSEPKQQAPSALVLKVLVPEEDAIVLVNQKATEGRGKERRITPGAPPAGKNFHTVTAMWEPNNYTKFTRTRKVPANAKGDPVVVDLTKAYDTEKINIRYVPTPDDVVAKMCQLAKVTKKDTVFDLGCGDGRIVIQAVEKFAAKRGVGIDLDEERVRESKANAKAHKVEDKVVFRVGDVLDIKDLSDADVVMLYMGDDINVRLRPILQKTLKPGSRIVSHRFLMGDWKPARTEAFTAEDGDEYEVHLWVIGERKK